MGSDPARYAIYFVPHAQSALAAFGEAILGGDQPAPTLAAGIKAHLFDAPRVYGFHATLKAPFHLADGTNAATLLVSARAFSATKTAFRLRSLAVAVVDDFIALVPDDAAPELDALAAGCVRAFEPFRAALHPRDYERRLAAGLTPQERQHLDTWGYPYVLDQFRFHMTLTGQLPATHAAEVFQVLEAHYATFDREVEIDAITVCCQPRRDARFEIVERFALRNPHDGKPPS
jgi:Protein of unknown function (DUF1045)